jgi:hypothetical protein
MFLNQPPRVFASLRLRRDSAVEDGLLGGSATGDDWRRRRPFRPRGTPRCGVKWEELSPVSILI